MRMKKNFKVFVADVDGTLRSRTVRIPQKETIQAFEKMHQEGMIVGIASGRPLWQGLKDHHKEWKLSFQFDFLIGMNGGEIWEKSTNKTTQYNPLTVEQLKAIVETFKDIQGINPFVYRDGYELSRYIDDEIIQSGLRHSCKVEACTSDADLYAEPTGKILYRCDSIEIADELEHLGKTILPKEIACFKTNDTLVELQNASVTKGSGITHFCHEHNIPFSSVNAFGDAENDIEMLKCAGWSVCLKNGMDDVKDITDDITEYASSEDGVGKYLLKNIL